MNKVNQKSLKMFRPLKFRTLFCSPKMQLQYASLYEVLGVSVNASQAEIKKGYLAKSKKFHPDFNMESDTKLEFLKVQNAYNTLSNPLQKSAYDHAFNSLKDKDMFHQVFHTKAQTPNVWEYCHHFHHSAQLRCKDPPPTKMKEETKAQQFVTKNLLTIFWSSAVVGSIVFGYVAWYFMIKTGIKTSATVDQKEHTNISPLRVRQQSSPTDLIKYKELDIPKRKK